MIDTQVIKNKILNLAMRGQLTEQMLEDGTAEELYVQIIEEKARLVKEGIIKKEKTFGNIPEEDIPFKIPSNWKWVGLKEICKKIVDGDHNPPSGVAEKTEYLMLSAQNINNDKIVNIDKARYLSKEVFVEENKRTRLEVGDVLLTIVATLGRSCVYREKYNVCFQRSVCVISTLINPDFLKRYLDCEYIQKLMIDNATGAAQPGFYLNKVEKIFVPLPPIAEQSRIVEKIETVFEVLNKIDALQNQYTSNQEALKSKLIDAAIQGKLTEQLPEDGTAEELFEQIQDETLILSKEGRFKKKKALPDLSDADYPFEIPETWKWIHLGDVLSIESGKGLTAAEMIPGDVPVYGGNGITGYHDNGFVPEGTVVIGRVGYYCGSVHITRSESWVTDNAFITTYPEHCIDKWFLVYVLKKMKLGQNNNGSAQPVVSGKKIYPLAFPLPPLAEQKRIADIFKTIIPMFENTK